MKYIARIIVLPIGLLFMILEPVVLSFIHATDWFFDEVVNWWLEKEWKDE